LDCAEEVAVLRREVDPLVGGESNLAFDVLNGRMTILDSAMPVSADKIRAVVGRTGMTAVEWQPLDSEARDAAAVHYRHQVWFTTLSGFCVVVGLMTHVWFARGLADALRLLGTHAGQAIPWPEIAAYSAAIVFGGRFVIVKAWYSAKALRPDMNLLMTVAVIGAIAIGEWFEAATVSFLFALSLMLESWSVGRARRAIAALLDLAPPVVRIIRADGSEAEIAAAEARPGDHFIVQAGQRIPLDGRVVAGTSAVNQAPITGESVPVEKGADAEVYAGTINGDGVLTVEATKTVENTTLARIIHMVEEAHARRAPSEQWVERFARVYTPRGDDVGSARLRLTAGPYRRRLACLVLSRPRVARDRLPLCPRHLDAGIDCRIACSVGTSRRTRQGRRLHRASRASEGNRRGQDRNHNARRAGGCARGAVWRSYGGRVARPRRRA
jgi:Zn2+/Cd2+-exporting ATPase